MANKIQNMQVKDAGFYYIGHFNAGELRIYFSNCYISVNPIKCKKMFELLYYIFGIDSEDGVFFEQIKGKYCRIETDDQFRIVAIKHIIDDYTITIEELQGK